MSQDPNDPRVQAFYHQQRLNAEKAALGGSDAAASQVGQIGAKLQKSGDAGKRAIGNRDKTIANAKNTEGAVDNSMSTIGQLPMLAMGGPALGTKGIAAGAGVVKQLAEHPAAIEEIARAAGRSLARKLFPDAEEAVAGASNRVGRRAAATIKNVTPKPSVAASGRVGAQKALPKNVTVDRGRAAVKSKLDSARDYAKKQVTKKAEPAPQKALPKPKDPSPKMQHGKVTAGKPRALQNTTRNKGTNPRALKKTENKSDFAYDKFYGPRSDRVPSGALREARNAKKAAKPKADDEE